MAVKHPFVSQVTDIGGPTYVQPTHWNSPHNSPFHVLWDFNNNTASFGVPSTAGATGFEYLDNTSGALRQAIDFTYIDTLYVGIGVSSIANTGGVSGGSVALRLQYMPSGFSGSWYSLDATGGSAPFVSMATGNNASLYLASANGQRLSATIAVSAAVKALPQPVTVRFAGYGGNGSALNLSQFSVFGL